MSEAVQLRFLDDRGGLLALPEECSITVAHCEHGEICQAIAAVIEQVLYGLALFGLDLRALDGVTLAQDCVAEAAAIQRTPEGQNLPDAGDRPDVMEMARTVAVWRGDELRFHIVLRTGLALMVLSPEKQQQRLAYGCIAHEAAHVDHEGRLYRSFPKMFGRPLECGDRSRQIYLRAMDVWSEYAACRSSASFRPEAVQEFEDLFCRTLESRLAACEERIAVTESGGRALKDTLEFRQSFGDLFIHAGYFLGHLDGLELRLEQDAPQAWSLLAEHPRMQTLIMRLGHELQELWRNEYDWQSVEVFAPIYELIGAMVVQRGF